MKSMVFWEFIARMLFASLTASSISFLPAVVALIEIKRDFVAPAITLAIVVLPVPGGP